MAFKFSIIKIKWNILDPLECENDLLGLLPTGYTHNKPALLKKDSKGNMKDVYKIPVSIKHCFIQNTFLKNISSSISH